VATGRRGLVDALAQHPVASLEALSQIKTSSIIQAPARQLQSAGCGELAMAARQRVADDLLTRELRMASSA
jgi:hypothetical protein